VKRHGWVEDTPAAAPQQCIRGCTYHDGNPRPQREGLLCRACAYRLRRHITQAPAVHAWLWLAMVREQSGTEPISGSREAPLPIRVALHDLRDDLTAVMASWADVVASESRLVGPEGDSLTHTVPWLLRHLQGALSRIWVGDLADEMADLHRRAYLAAPWDRERRDLPAPCPECGLLTLALYGGADEVVCRNAVCGETIPSRLYDHYVRVLADEHRATVTAA
jgi:hypothetical protein